MNISSYSFVYQNFDIITLLGVTYRRGFFNVWNIPILGVFHVFPWPGTPLSTRQYETSPLVSYQTNIIPYIPWRCNFTDTYSLIQPLIFY